MTPSEQLIITALVTRLGGKVELTDLELATAETSSVTVWQVRDRRATVITTESVPTGPLEDLGETEIIDEQPAIEGPSAYDYENYECCASGSCEVCRR